jgi:hypothetical protein
VTPARKEAGLQTPELTDRNCIRGRESWVSKHIFAKPLTNKRFFVDAAGLGGRISVLPGRSPGYGLAWEKSAAAIVATWKRAVSTTEVSHGGEGPNVKFVPNSIGRFTD